MSWPGRIGTGPTLMPCQYPAARPRAGVCVAGRRPQPEAQRKLSRVLLGVYGLPSFSRRPPALFLLAQLLSSVFFRLPISPVIRANPLTPLARNASTWRNGSASCSRTASLAILKLTAQLVYSQLRIRPVFKPCLMYVPVSRRAVAWHCTAVVHQ